jgi:hypothetical protein
VVFLDERVESRLRRALGLVPTSPFHEEHTVVLVRWKLAVVQVWQSDVADAVPSRCVVLVEAALDRLFPLRDFIEEEIEEQRTVRDDILRRG